MLCYEKKRVERVSSREGGTVRYMVSFENDYIAGAHPKILQRLVETNFESLSGYGNDSYCESARRKIKDLCNCPEADVFFLAGGTQTNAIVISALLREHEGVVAARTGHVSTHEAGAIEATGHKVLEIDQKHGKIEAVELERYLKEFYQDKNCEHMVFPGMVYISYPTEYGTIYSREELREIYNICREYDMPLYIDGARLGYGLMSKEADLTLEDIARLCDVFYIGGTKVGALCGEAVVFTKRNTPKHFLTVIKRHGALLAKGRLLGIQFDTLFSDNLYFDISKNAVEMAEQMKEIVREAGIAFYLESPTNQQFIILEDEQADKLKDRIAFSFWEKVDESHTVVRLATSWSTTEEDLAQLKVELR